MTTTAEFFASRLGDRTNLWFDDVECGCRRPLRMACNRAKASAVTVEDANGDMRTTYTFPDGSSITHHIPNVADPYWTI